MVTFQNLLKSGDIIAPYTLVKPIEREFYKAFIESESLSSMWPIIMLELGDGKLKILRGYQLIHNIRAFKCCLSLGDELLKPRFVRLFNNTSIHVVIIEYNNSDNNKNLLQSYI